MDSSSVRGLSGGEAELAVRRACGRCPSRAVVLAAALTFAGSLTSGDERAKGKLRMDLNQE